MEGDLTALSGLVKSNTPLKSLGREGGIDHMKAAQDPISEAPGHPLSLNPVIIELSCASVGLAIGAREELIDDLIDEPRGLPSISEVGELWAGTGIKEAHGEILG